MAKDWQELKSGRTSQCNESIHSGPNLFPTRVNYGISQKAIVNEARSNLWKVVNCMYHSTFK
jgi:hypothetical protein